MKKLSIYVTTILILFLFNRCGIIKEFKSQNNEELFKVYTSTYREIDYYDDETKNIEKTFGINVELINDSIMNKYNINRESAELEIVFKNNIFKSKSAIRKNNHYLQFYYLGYNLENLHENEYLTLWNDKFEVTLKIEVNGSLRTFMYISE